MRFSSEEPSELNEIEQDLENQMFAQLNKKDKIRKKKLKNKSANKNKSNSNILEMSIIREESRDLEEDLEGGSGTAQ